MKTTLVFLLSACLIAIAANSSRTGVRNQLSTGKLSKTEGEIVVHQVCNPAATMEEISSLKRQVEIMKKELTLRLDKKDNKVSVSVNLLQKEVEQLGKRLTQRMDKIQTSRNKDAWIKLNTAPVCFGARGDQFGKFLVPAGGKLAAVKLVHLYGYVTCDKSDASFWSYWGCSIYHGLKEKVNVVITTSKNRILLPSSQFTFYSTKWSRSPGYNSFSPELVMSAFSNPPSVTKGQQLRLWYGEDLVNSSEGDNDGKACCNVYAHFI